jgi:hypothetical protein
MALWIKRYLIIIPTLETPLLPLQDMRTEYIHYQATLVEWLLTFSGIALFIFLFFIFSKLMPIVSIVKGEEGTAYAELRKTVLERVIKRKVRETKIKESEKLADL